MHSDKFSLFFYFYSQWLCTKIETDIVLRCINLTANVSTTIYNKLSYILQDKSIFRECVLLLSRLDVNTYEICDTIHT